MLPPELITHLISFIHDRKQLKETLLVSKQWYKAGILVYYSYLPLYAEECIFYLLNSRGGYEIPY
jgi:hypothetical protein